MPLSQTRQRRQGSPSCLRTCFRPPREGAGRTNARRVTRSVHDFTSRLSDTSARAAMKHLDQASLDPLGTEERPRLSLVKTSQTPGAPSPSGRVASETSPCWEEEERKQEGQRPFVETETQNPLAHFTGAEPVSTEASPSECHQGAAPRGEHRCGSTWSRRWTTRERGEHGRDRGGPGRRAWRGNVKERGHED